MALLSESCQLLAQMDHEVPELDLSMPLNVSPPLCAAACVLCCGELQTYVVVFHGVNINSHGVANTYCMVSHFEP